MTECNASCGLSAPRCSDTPLLRTFFAASREWLTRYDDSTATTDDFEAVFEEVSGQDLTTFFDVWVRTPIKPTTW